MFIAAEQSGLKTNKDPNAGNPLGMGMGTITVYKDRRISASVAYLDNPPPNLTICTASPVARVVFKGKKTIGIETNDGRAFFASKEVIISGGALSTPQILLLSGIGPQEELEQHGIPVVHHLPMVGKNLRDHCFSSVGIAMTRSAMSADDRGRQCPSPMYWGKLSTALASPEFDALPAGLKQFLQKPTVPSFEIVTVCPYMRNKECDGHS
jgi:choline dehydrogenase-like flavoprotein